MIWEEAAEIAIESHIQHSFICIEDFYATILSYDHKIMTYKLINKGYQ